MTLKKTNLEIVGRPSFASVGGSAFKKRRIINQSLSTKGFIKFQTITIMQSTKHELSPYNQIYFSKQVFVNTTKHSNIFIFTFVKRHIFTENSHRIFSIIYPVDPPFRRLLSVKSSRDITVAMDESNRCANMSISF